MSNSKLRHQGHDETLRLIEDNDDVQKAYANFDIYESDMV